MFVSQFVALTGSKTECKTTINVVLVKFSIQLEVTVANYERSSRTQTGSRLCEWDCTKVKDNEITSFVFEDTKKRCKFPKFHAWDALGATHENKFRQRLCSKDMLVCHFEAFEYSLATFMLSFSYIDLNRWIDDSWVEDTWGKMKNSESLVTGLCGRGLAPGFVYSFQRRGLDVWADGCSASCVLWMSDMRGRSWMEILQPLVFVSSNGIPSTMI